MSTLHERMDALPANPARRGHGPDIDAAHEIMLNEASRSAKTAALMRWLAKDQPCLFGRMAARSRYGVIPRVDVCFIDSGDLERGVAWVTERVQEARRVCKDRAARGEVSGFLVMFNDARLAQAAPSLELVHLCEDLCGCLLVEQHPVRADAIYTEAMPLEAPDGQLALSSRRAARCSPPPRTTPCFTTIARPVEFS